MNKADMETRCPRVSQEELDEALRKIRRDEWFLWLRLFLWAAILLGFVASIVWMFVRG